MKSTIPMRKNMPTSGSDLQNGSGVAGATVDDALDTLDADKQALDGMLTALSAIAATGGIFCLSAADTPVMRTLTGPAAGITVTNGDGMAGNPTIALADDLAALEALSSTGIAVRTGTSTWAQRSVATANSGRITVTNGDGVSGNPTVDLATVISATGPIGAAGTVPIVTVDDYGRVTALTSTAITGAALTLTDVTTNNVSTSKHGFFPKLDGTATHFIDMTGVQRALAAADLGTTMQPQFGYVAINTAIDTTYRLKIDDSLASVLCSFTTSFAGGQAAFNLGYSGQLFRVGANSAYGGFAINDTTAGANRLLITTGGDMSCGNVSSLLARIEARKTSGAQLAASYDGSNYMTQTVDSTGLCTWTGAGTGKGHVFTDGIRVGSGAGRAKVQGVRKTIVTTSTNTTTGETDLHSVTIDANSLAADGDEIRFTMGFMAAANANGKTIKVKFGATTIFDSTSIAANNVAVLIKGVIYRTGAATQVAFTEISAGGGYTMNVTRAAPTETLSSSSVLKATGQATSTADITQYLTVLEYIPANP